MDRRIATLILGVACSGPPAPPTDAAGSDTARDTLDSTPPDDTGPTGTETGTETTPDGAAVALLQITVDPYGDPADLFHPVADAGLLPTVVFLQGADVERIHYREWASRLAAFGYLVVVPDHERTVAFITGLYPEVGLVDAAIAAVRAEGDRPGSAIEGRVDPDRSAIAGHSLGGVAGLEAVAGECSALLCTSGTYTRPDSLRAIATYGTNRKPPGFGSIPETDNDGLPLLLVQGAADGAVDPGDTLTTWQQVLDPPKSLLLVDGANHYSITNRQDPPGALPESSPATLDQAAGIDLLATWMGRFLDAHVRGDPAALAWFGGGTTDPEPGVTLTTETAP
jgi:dienelactone hydrolase